jgi:hypothetical protein
VVTIRLDHVTTSGDLFFFPEWQELHALRVPIFPVIVERTVYEKMFSARDQLISERRGLASGPHCSLLRLIDWSAPK